MAKIFGYVRVSTVVQHEDRQVIALQEFGVPDGNIIVEKMSGKNFRRPLYRKLVNKLLSPGDVLVIKSLDRLGRDYEAILAQWRYLTKELGVDIVVLDMPLLDTRAKNQDLTGSFIADLVLQVLSYVSETERECLRKRQSEGIAAAKARGVQFGRPYKDNPENFGELIERWEEGELSLNQITKLCGFEKSTFYRRLGEYKKVQ